MRSGLPAETRGAKKSLDPVLYRGEPMTQAHDAEHQTPAAPSPTGSSEMKGEHYTMGHARLGRYAGERRGVPATRAGQGGAYAVVSLSLIHI